VTLNYRVATRNNGKGNGTHRKNPKGSRKNPNKNRINKGYRSTSTNLIEGRPYRVTLRPGIIIPDELRVTLKYTQQMILTETTGTATNYLFRGNGPFDPDLTGTGAQPSGYDQWSAFYQMQRTLGSRIRVKAISLSQSLTFFRFVLAPITSITPFNAATGIDNFAVSKYAQMAEIVTNTKPIPLTAECSTAKIFGKSLRDIEGEDDYASLISATPAFQWAWQIMMDALDLTNTASVTFIVELEYDVVFWDRVNVGLS